MVIALAAVAMWTIYQVRTVAIPVVLALFLASVTVPPTNWLAGRGINRALATTLVWLALILLGTGAILLLLPPTLRGATELGSNLDLFTGNLQDFGRRVGLDQQRIADLTAQGKDWLSKRSGAIAGGAVTGVTTAAEIVIGAVLAFVLSIYLTHGGGALLRWLSDLAPARARPRILSSVRLSFDVVGRYIRGIFVVGFVDAFFIGVSLWVLGVPLAIPLAVLTWVGAFLPMVGAFIAGLLAAIVAFVAKGWVVAMIVIAVTVAVQQIEGHVLAPQIYGRALDLPGAVILVSIAVGATVAGIIGAFLAAPVASVAVALLRQARKTPSPT